MLPSASKSTESLYSNSSSKFSVGALYKRKSGGGSNKSSNTNIRTAGYIPVSNDIRQRVLSARRLRMKTLQNQLTDAEMHIGELAQENRILRTLHKRQDNALSKYENTNAELPQLLHSHAEEVRVWQTKYRTLQQQNKELIFKLKQKDSVILNLTDENKHLTQLNNDKHLEEREVLAERVKSLETNLAEKDNDLKLLARRIQLETKTFKSQLHNEQSRYKDVVSKLQKTEKSAFDKLDPLTISDQIARASLLPKNLFNTNKKITKQLTSSEESLPDIRNTKTKPNSEKNLNDSIARRLSSSLERNKIHKPLHHLESLSKSTDDLAEIIKMGMQPNSTLEYVDNTATITEYSDDSKNVENICDEIKTDDIKNNEIDFPNDYDEDDFFEHFGKDNDVILSSDLPRKTKKEFESIRKKVTDDYKERQSYLDSFCRESSADALNDCIKRPIDIKKKVSLLAALKSIEEKESS